MSLTPHRGRLSNATAASYMSMATTSDDDTMEESSVFTLSSPPRSASKSLAAAALFEEEQATPKSSRRLFFGDDDDYAADGNGMADVKPPVLTPYKSSRSTRRAATTRPAHHHHRQDSLDSSSGGGSEDLSGRKRGSEERRESHESSDTTMHMSPGRMSPNSYVTMDGRFVHSKNPFSSPMITEDDSTHNNNLHPMTMAGAPAFPLNFASHSNNEVTRTATTPTSPHRPSGTVALLPPRHAREKRATYHRERYEHQDGDPMMVRSDGEGTFLDARFSFTGSPIPEHARASSPSPLPTNTSFSAAAMGSTTAGSLIKVRRLNKNDDVVSASGQHIYSRRNNFPHNNLSVDTAAARLSTASISDVSNGTWKPDQDKNDDVSPTDILSFPPPPTPAKKNSSRMHRRMTRPEPPTPVAQRRHEKLLQRRTAHPGSILRRHQPDAEEQLTTIKSRFHDDFDTIQELGKGSFGTVFQVLSRLDGCMYAIKAAHRPAKGVADRDRMMKEVYALAALSDQADTATFHIVRYHQAWMEDDRLFIQTELCQGNLIKEMSQNRLNLPRRYKLLREMCLALAFLHRHHMVHLDIKPDNIFIKNDQFKLGDFGLVSKSSSHEDVEEGDSRYMSLELLSGDHSDLTKSDIFSLGATLYEICRGHPLPLNGPEWQAMRHGHLLHIVEDGTTVDSDLVKFIHQMMDADPHARPAPSTLLQHPKLLSDDQKALLAERHKVEQANLALQRLSPRPPPTRPRLFGNTRLQRSNTWSGQSCYF